MQQPLSVLSYKNLTPSKNETKVISQPKVREGRSHEKLKKIMNNMQSEIQSIEKINKQFQFKQNNKNKAHFNADNYSNEINLPDKHNQFAEITFRGNDFRVNPEKDQRGFDILTKRSPEEINKQLQANRRRREYSDKNKRPHHPSQKIQSIITRQIREDKQKNPKKYIIMCGELGLTEEDVYRMKGGNLNYELQRFGKNKGIEYLKEANYKVRSASEKYLGKLHTQPSTDIHYQEKVIEHTKKSKSKDVKIKVKYPNYIPEVFAGLKAKKEKQSQQKKSQVSVPVSLEKDLLKNKKIKKFEQLTDKEQILGKIVLEKVKRHFKNDKEKKKDYYSRVKSEQNIDDTLIEYLKTKMDRADLLLKK